MSDKAHAPGQGAKPRYSSCPRFPSKRIGFAPGSQDQQRLFKARVVTGQISHIGGMFAVAVDDQRVVAGIRGTVQSGVNPRLIRSPPVSPVESRAIRNPAS